MGNLVTKTTAAALLAALTIAPAANAAPRWYLSNPDSPGFYWEKDTKDPDKKEEKKEEPPKRRLPDAKDYTTEQMWNMHPQDFQQLLNDFRDKAVMTLKEEDVEAYKRMQDIARRKAVAYMNVDRVVTLKNPDISFENVAPTNTPGGRATTRMQIAEMENMLAARKTDHALFFFTSPTCPYCTEQEKIIRIFEARTGWEVRRINADTNPDAKEAFGVTLIPALILAKKGVDDHFPVSSGVITVEEMEDRIYAGVSMLGGKTSIQQYGVRDNRKGTVYDPLAPLQKERGGKK
ncbi:MAG: conjugal transfer protein TraF [Trichlorobacter sp.]|nr:conjugal transfer protein TraF [Trichlorobacter sp.]